jgi:phage N-6-adenine-methyltransferase
MINAGMMSSKTDEHATPQAFFDDVSKEFGPFDVDVCANEDNAKCARWFGKSPAGGGLNELWTGKVWMNPPYGREIKHWVKKASESASRGGGNRG